MNIDRPRRELLVQHIDRYLNDELTAFEFDEAIFAVRDSTDDPAVRAVVDELWHFYDDCDDHPVVLDRTSWNYFQRLRLVLKSNATLEISRRRLWSPAQLVAAAALAAFAWAVYVTGVGQHLYLVALPFGLCSIALSSWRRRAYRAASHVDPTLYPFASVAEILWVGRDLADFHKQKYPPSLAERTIRTPSAAFVLWFQHYTSWILYGPVPLAFQILPMSIASCRIVR